MSSQRWCSEVLLVRKVVVSQNATTYSTWQHLRI
jgi:hypothetical protein